MSDKSLNCRDCGQAFLFTAGEQEYYSSRGFQNEPSRCPDCRAQRKGRQGEGGSDSGYSRSGDRGARTMFTAVCASCGGEAQLPFEPRGDRPVYCSNCYAQQRGDSAGSDRRTSSRRY